MKVGLNERVGAITFGIYATLSLIFLFSDASLLPLRLFSICLGVYGVIFLCEAMGARYPLICGGFVLFCFSAIMQIFILLARGIVDYTYYMFASITLLSSFMLWSIAYMHRPQKVRYIGRVGVVASLMPLIGIILGHLAVGAGTIFGFSLLATAENVTLYFFVIQNIFALWCVGAAYLLWTGELQEDY